MNGIDAIVFDLGNTLIAYDHDLASERLAARTGKSQQQVDEYGLTTPYLTELCLGRLSKMQFYRTVARDLGFDGSYEEFALLWSDIFTPIEPMIAFAESLRTRLPRLILSNTNAIHMDFIFARYAFIHGFDAHIFSHEVGLLKPDAAIYEHTLRKYGLTAGRTVLVDDLQANVEGARRVGMQAVHFQGYEPTFAELTKLGLSPI